MTYNQCNWYSLMSKDISIKKRNGKTEKFNADKINRVLQWSVEGLKNVSFEEVAMNAHLNFFDGMKTTDIHSTLIESAASLISEEKSDYQYVAGRLLNYQLRKSVWGGKNPPRLFDLVKDNVKEGVYDPDILSWYTKEEFDKINEFIKHDRDFDLTYAGIRQFQDKYLVQNRLTKRIYETPQFSYVLIAATFFHSYQDDRLAYIKKAYDCFSKFKISLPTPIMSGARTNQKSYASCCLIQIDDTLNSIFASNTAIGLATANSYGIGISPSRIRGTNTPIRGGAVIHPGPIPFSKIYESTVKASHQNSRGGSATANFAWFHWDIQEILVLKNNSGTDDNRVKKLDYCIGLDKVILERFIKDKEITLFSYHECPELWNNHGLENFQELYEAAEANKEVKFKKKIKARELMFLLAKERLETGRIYVLFVDHANSHGSWKGHVDMTNLCLEICHTLKPIQSIEDPNGEIGVCVLSALNLLNISSEKEMEDCCDIVTRSLDSLIDHQDYFVPAARNFCVNRRSIGVGVTNLAGYLAKFGIKYFEPEAPNVIARKIEQMAYYLTKSSIQLAREFGPCPKYSETKYSDGILPIDNYKKEIDSFVTAPLEMDWEGLRKDLKTYGIRHSTLMANMPCEASSLILNSTNGMEPPRSMVSFKGSKTSIVPVVVPNIDRDGDNYTLAFDMPSNDGYLKVNAAMQKFIDMAMSTNTYYVPSRYPSNNVPVEEVLRDILTAYKYGIKSLYYANTDDGSFHSSSSKFVAKEDAGCSSGACSA